MLYLHSSLYATRKEDFYEISNRSKNTVQFILYLQNLPKLPGNQM